MDKLRLSVPVLQPTTVQNLVDNCIGLYRNFNVFVEAHCMRLKTVARLKRVDKIETHAMRLYINIGSRIKSLQKPA